MLRSEILEFYRRGGERERLARGKGRLEFLRTWDVLTRVLPPAPAAVLDVGGAFGVYAGPLAEAGYRVLLVDPVPEHVAGAAGLPGVEAVAGDARALPVEDGAFDAVLLFGPLYHLPDRPERMLAWREAARAVRPGGLVVAATISRYAGLFDAFVQRYAHSPRFRSTVDGVLATGEHHDPDGESGFTTAYFHLPHEAAKEAEEAGLRVDRVVPVESPLWMTSDLDELFADDDLTGLLLELLRRIEDEPGLLAASAHLLTVARRPA